MQLSISSIFRMRPSLKATADNIASLLLSAPPSLHDACDDSGCRVIAQVFDKWLISSSVYLLKEQALLEVLQWLAMLVCFVIAIDRSFLRSVSFLYLPLLASLVVDVVTAFFRAIRFNDLNECRQPTPLYSHTHTTSHYWSNNWLAMTTLAKSNQHDEERLEYPLHTTPYCLKAHLIAMFLVEPVNNWRDLQSNEWSARMVCRQCAAVIAKEESERAGVNISLFLKNSPRCATRQEIIGKKKIIFRRIKPRYYAASIKIVSCLILLKSSSACSNGTIPEARSSFSTA